MFCYPRQTHASVRKLKKKIWISHECACLHISISKDRLKQVFSRPNMTNIIETNRKQCFSLYH